MRERILKLCKRLDKFTLDEIAMISEIEEDELLPVLNELISENSIILRNETYFYQKKKIREKNISKFRAFPEQTIDLVIRCFCSDITADKTYKIVGIGENTVLDFYRFFRKSLHDRQIRVLQEQYNKKPQIVRERTFFNTEIVYFYIYNNQVYIIDKPLHSKKDENTFSKDEIKEFKKIYCYLKRSECHNKNKICLYQKLSEALWRRNKSFLELYDDMKMCLYS